MASVLVLGSAGMAGHAIARSLLESDHKVLGLQRRPATSEAFPIFVGDGLDRSTLMEVLSSTQFDLVVNCIGVLNTSADDDPALTVRTNSLLPRLLEDMTRGLSTRLVHVSTDCVFSGRSGNYREDSWTDAIDLYGVSKAAGEVTTSATTLRTSIVGPEINVNGTGLLHWFLTSQGPVRGYRNAVWGGVTTLVLAKFVEWILQSDPGPGLIHVTNGQGISKLDLLQLFAEEFRPNVTISPIPGPSVDKSLARSSVPGVPSVPSYADMVSEMGTWMRQHRDLYSAVYDVL